MVSGAGLGTIKLDAAGHPLWKRSFDGHVAIDSKGNVLMTGSFTDPVDFGGGSLVSAGGEDIFVAKLDPAGNRIFSRRFGDAGPHQRGEAIAIDFADDLLVSGVLDGVVDFGDGPISVPNQVHAPRKFGANKLDSP